MPLEQYLMLLRVNGQFIQIGAPEDKLPPIGAFSLMVKGVKIGGSSIGSPKQIEQMLELAAKKGVRTWNQNWPMKECNKAVVDMDNGKARYRYVLVNEENAKL
jgi:alcohol dehydrogenase (NADP+)